MQHEIQHAVQYNELDSFSNKETTNGMTPRQYIISHQEVARDFSKALNTKYYDQSKDINRLYRLNHDQFYIEMEADKVGIENMKSLFKQISPSIYKLVTNPKYTRIIDERYNATKKQLSNYNESNIEWNHETNVNGQGVLANHKASMIIDYILPLLSQKDRESYFKKFPSLSLTYNSNGSKKTLEQIEKERNQKIKSSIAQAMTKRHSNTQSIAALYDTAIESDATLCFEQCLKRIITSTDIKTLNENKIKAEKIAGYIEDMDALKIKNLLDKYKTLLENDKKLNSKNSKLYQEKQLAFSSITNELNQNKEAKETLEKSKKSIEQKENAIKLLKDVFPDFDYTPHIYDPLTGSVINNVKEKLVLYEAEKRYGSTIAKMTTANNFIPKASIREAIKTLYPFEVTQNDENEFKKELEKGQVNIYQNKYEIESNINKTQTNTQQVGQKVNKENDQAKTFEDIVLLYKKIIFPKSNAEYYNYLNSAVNLFELRQKIEEVTHEELLKNGYSTPIYESMRNNLINFNSKKNYYGEIFKYANEYITYMEQSKNAFYVNDMNQASKAKALAQKALEKIREEIKKMDDNQTKEFKKCMELEKSRIEYKIKNNVILQLRIDPPSIEPYIDNDIEYKQIYTILKEAGFTNVKRETPKDDDYFKKAIERKPYGAPEVDEFGVDLSNVHKKPQDRSRGR